MVSVWVVWFTLGIGIAIGIIVGYELRIIDERRVREERLWMRLLYQNQLNK